MRKLDYCNEDIYVFLIHGKEAPKYILQASETSFDPDRRVSKRSRKTNNGDQISLKVSGSTSIYQLKMMIWESFGVCYLKLRHACIHTNVHMHIYCLQFLSVYSISKIEIFQFSFHLSLRWYSRLVPLAFSSCV